MAQTHSWLSLAEAASVLDIREYQVLDLAVSGWLRSRVDVDHRELSAADVEEFASELDASRGALLAESKPKPTWTPWSGADHPEDRDDQDDA